MCLFKRIHSYYTYPQYEGYTDVQNNTMLNDNYPHNFYTFANEITNPPEIINSFNEHYGVIPDYIDSNWTWVK